jgi:broad specificity phosphatase PhoE
MFIRHGEKHRRGQSCHDLTTIKLTARGHEHARAVMVNWTLVRALIDPRVAK